MHCLLTTMLLALLQVSAPVESHVAAPAEQVLQVLEAAEAKKGVSFGESKWK